MYFITGALSYNQVYVSLFLLLRSVQVCSFVGLPELYYAGSHGMDIKGPSSKVCIAGHLIISPCYLFIYSFITN